jgi:hypothetical protein
VKALSGVAAALVLLLVPSSGVAQMQLPVDEADGVRVVREKGGIVVFFTARAAKLYKRIAGKRILVSCTELPKGDGFGFTSTNSGEVLLRAPQRRRKLVTGDRTRGMDYCRVWLAPRTVTRNGERHRVGRVLVVSVPLTQTGAVFLDEQSKTIELAAVLTLASLVADEEKLDAYPTHAQLLEAIPKVDGDIVALANPTDAPPPGVVGYYSDGQEHIAVAVLSRSGRRLFIDYAGDVLSTNVAGYYFDDIE